MENQTISQQQIMQRNQQMMSHEYARRQEIQARQQQQKMSSENFSIHQESPNEKNKVMNENIGMAMGGPESVEQIDDAISGSQNASQFPIDGNMLRLAKMDILDNMHQEDKIIKDMISVSQRMQSIQEKQNKSVPSIRRCLGIARGSTVQI